MEIRETNPWKINLHKTSVWLYKYPEHEKTIHRDVENTMKFFCLSKLLQLRMVSVSVKWGGVDSICWCLQSYKWHILRSRQEVKDLLGKAIMTSGKKSFEPLQNMYYSFITQLFINEMSHYLSHDFVTTQIRC